MHYQLRDTQTALSQKSLRLHPLSNFQTACLAGCDTKRQSRNITLYLARYPRLLLFGYMADF